MKKKPFSFEKKNKKYRCILFEADEDLGPTNYNDEEEVDTEDDTDEESDEGVDTEEVDEDLGPTDYNDEEVISDDGGEEGDSDGDESIDTTTDETGDTGSTDEFGGDSDMDDSSGDLDSLESDADDPSSSPDGDGTDVEDNENSNDEQTNNDDDQQNNENNKFLINDYLELYNRLDEILEKINSNENFKFSRDMIYNKARMNIEKIRDMLFDYITLRFNNESYVSNLYHFNLVMQAINVNIGLLENSPTILELEDNKKK